MRLLLGAALVLLVGAVFAQSRNFEFLRFDDQTYVSKNPDVASGLTVRSVAWAFTTGRAANWHPLTWISHMVDVDFFGMRPAGHHLVNVALHALTTLLLFSFLLRLVISPWAAAALAALWAVHPLRCESVAWIAERKDVLSGLFWMATVNAWICYGEGRRPRVSYALALTWFALGLLSKPMLVTLPIVMLLLDLWPQERRPTLSLVVEKLPFFGLAAASSLVTLLVQQGGGAVARIDQVPAGLRLANAIVGVPTYLVRTLWPARLAAFYPFDPALAAWKVAAAGAAMALATAAAVVYRRKLPFLATGWGWFLISLIPVSGLVQIGFQSTADRYTYIPSIGLAVILAGAIQRLEATRPAAARAAVGLSALAVVPLAFLAYRQAGTWRDGVTLFKHAIAVTGPNYVAERHLVHALTDEGRNDEAIELRVRQLESHALPGERDREAMPLLNSGKIDPARQILEAEVRQNPGNGEAICHLGIALAMLGRIDEAAARFEEAIRVTPEYANAYYNLGLAREKQGRDPEAAAAYKRSLQLDPQNSDSRNNLARVVARLAKGGR